jgi:hypothetical protein
VRILRPIAIGSEGDKELGLAFLGGAVLGEREHGEKESDGEEIAAHNSFFPCSQSCLGTQFSKLRFESKQSLKKRKIRMKIKIMKRTKSRIKRKRRTPMAVAPNLTLNLDLAPHPLPNLTRNLSPYPAGGT